MRKDFLCERAAREDIVVEAVMSNTYWEAMPFDLWPREGEEVLLPLREILRKHRNPSRTLRMQVPARTNPVAPAVAWPSQHIPNQPAVPLRGDRQS